MPIFHKKRKIPFVTIAAFVFIFAVSMYAAFAEDAVVTDPNLKAALIALGADTTTDGELSSDEMAALTGDIDLSGKSISDISGLEYATGVTSFNLKNNTIRSIQPLVTLVGGAHALTSADVSQNYLVIADGSEDKLAVDALVLSLGVYDDVVKTGVIFDPQTPIPTNGLTLNVKTLQLGTGETATLTTAVTPDDAANKTVTWSSSDANVVTVSGGKVTAVSAGTARVTAVSASNTALTDTCTVTVKSYAIETTKYPIDRAHGVLRGVPKMTTSVEFLGNLRNAATDLALLDAAGNLCGSTPIKTGMTLVLNANGAQRDVLKIAVNGDGNGDGSVSVSDYTMARLYILGLRGLDDISTAACDINGDGKVSISDYTSMRLDILGLKAISPLPDLPAVSDPRIRAFLDVALMQQGKPYVWGARGPDSFDCSGYIYYCLNKAGYSIGRTTASSYSKNESWLYIPRDQLQPGDLMFYFDDDMATIGHVGIYLGNGYHIHASSDYGSVIICRIEGWYDRRLSHGRRVFF